jgi:hypothetical protein
VNVACVTSALCPCCCVMSDRWCLVRLFSDLTLGWSTLVSQLSGETGVIRLAAALDQSATRSEHGSQNSTLPRSRSESDPGERQY